MKHCLLALCAASSALLLASCAGTKITHTDVATGATNPRAIYIRPFDVTYCDYIGQHAGGYGERPIHRSLAPAEFANDLKVELAKIAPAVVLKDDETPHIGWLVTGEFEVVDAGHPLERALIGFNAGASHVKLHVRVIDLESKKTVADAKDANTTRELSEGRGNVIYEFDVAGGSRWQGPIGSIYAPGEGYSVPFDFKNAADRISMALQPDALRYGDHPTTVVR
ncbi:MAG TPA: DUF4410 domain-containing protein [Chthoniobacteraceae bacterium]|nr:DUF4410 domain-containing protein [Chthoniobacteraceae bacterium]